jgi:hypothetical protein
MLQKNKLDVVYRAVDQKADPRRSVIGSMRFLKNGVFPKIGRIDKRKGYDVRTATGLGSNPTSIFESDNRLYCMTDDGTYILAESANQWQLCNEIQDSGATNDEHDPIVRPLTVGRTVVSGGLRLQDPGDTPLVTSWVQSGYRGVAYSGLSADSVDTTLEVQDAQTGVVVARSTIGTFSGRNWARVVGAGTRLFFFVNESGTLNVYVFNTSSPSSAFPGSATAVSTMQSDGAFDVHYDSARDSMWVAYKTGTGTTFGIREVSNLAGIGTETATVGGSDSSSDGIAVFRHPDIDYCFIATLSNASGRSLIVPYRITTGAFGTAYDIGSSSISNHPIGFAKADANNYVLFYHNNDNAIGWAYGDFDSAATTPPYGDGGPVYGLVGAAKPFLKDDRPYLPVLATGGSGTAHLQLASPMKDAEGTGPGLLYKAAQLLTDNAGRIVPSDGSIFHQWQEDGDAFSFATLRRVQSFSVGVTFTTQQYTYSAEEITVEFTEDPVPRTVGLVASGDIFSLTRGGLSTLTPVAPAFSGNIVQSATGSIDITLNDVFSYRLVFEYEDAAGDLHRSAPSAGKSVTATSTDSTGAFTMSVTRPGAQEIPSVNPRWVLYRTEANGSVFYRTKTVPYDEDSPAVLVVIDTTSDADLIDNELLYTQGGELEATPPPAPLDVQVVADRAWIVSSENPRQAWHSKIKQPFFSYEFNSTLVLESPEDLTASAEMDGRFVAFSEDRIFSTGGAGPDNNGIGAFAPLTEISADAGCVQRPSVVSTPVGVMFMSRKGIRLLNRSLALEPIGDDVEDITLNATFKSAVLVASEDQVRWTITGAVTGGQQDDVLVYDYSRGLWSTFQLGGFGSSGDAAVFGDVHHMLEDGTSDVHAQSTVNFSDDGNHYPLRMRSNDILFDGIAGFQRIWRLIFAVVRRGQSGMTVEYSTDDRSDVTRTWSNTEFPALGVKTYLQVRLQGVYQKCERLVFEIQDTPPTGAADEGFSILGVHIEAGIKRGMKRLAPGNRK